MENLKIKKFECNLEWMLAICYHRGTLERYKSNQTIQNIVAEINAADVITAPIADNKMFYIMSQFTEGVTLIGTTVKRRLYILEPEKNLIRFNLKDAEINRI